MDDYQIDVELLPQTHKLTARAAVKVTALEDLNVATFQLNNALRITKLTDANNKPLTPERNTQDSTVRFALNSGLAKNASTTFTFEYEGTLESADDSPVQGLKLAYVGPDTSYLLYSGLWFPVAGYGVNRFTSTISVTVPAHMVVIGSGKEAVRDAVGVIKEACDRAGELQDLHLHLGKAEFSGHDHCRHIPGVQERRSGHRSACILQARQERDLGAEYARTAVKAFTYFVTQYGQRAFDAA